MVSANMNNYETDHDAWEREKYHFMGRQRLHLMATQAQQRNQ